MGPLFWLCSPSVPAPAHCLHDSLGLLDLAPGGAYSEAALRPSVQLTHRDTGPGVSLEQAHQGGGGQGLAGACCAASELCLCCGRASRAGAEWGSRAVWGGALSSHRPLPRACLRAAVHSDLISSLSVPI